MLNARISPLVYGAVGVAGFGLLLSLEVITNVGPLPTAELLLESLEIFLMIAAAGGMTLLFSQTQAHREEKAALIKELGFARVQGLAWRAKARHHISGLGAAILSQFERWAFSPAESEVAMLMLKGLSDKEIARLHHAGEATIRQQARVVFAKANVASRQSLCAFFLGDLLVPLTDNVSAPPDAESQPRTQ